MNKLRDDINGLVKCSLQTLRKRKKQSVSLRTAQSSSLLFPNCNNFVVRSILETHCIYLLIINTYMAFLGRSVCQPGFSQRSPAQHSLIHVDHTLRSQMKLKIKIRVNKYTLQCCLCEMLLQGGSFK